MLRRTPSIHMVLHAAGVWQAVSPHAAAMHPHRNNSWLLAAPGGALDQPSSLQGWGCVVAVAGCLKLCCCRLIAQSVWLQHQCQIMCRWDLNGWNSCKAGAGMEVCSLLWPGKTFFSMWPIIACRAAPHGLVNAAASKCSNKCSNMCNN
ncbi:hypothetical protein COO60DRAFT_914681 [Scenedesmus sp. NREL 46B-D3]|nr:hypothetical protein COO60DRAFT_914681 [Scenedesmus sp. NREL 46B-D3]